MAVTQLSILSERWLDEVVLFGSIDNVGGADMNESFILPAGIGDLAFMEGIVQGITQATAIALSTVPAVHMDVLSSDGATIVDIMGVFRWYQEYSTNVAAYISPDPLVLVRQSERIRILSPEIDSNVSPTADLRLVLKFVRVRPLEGTATGPIRLVR